MNGQFAQPYLGIGEVLVELRADFPDISVSKIRFLESEGLIAPARSPSGYRRFGPADVDQLRFILTAQRDQYLPLRVIKERLVRRGQSVGSGGGMAARAADQRPTGRQTPGQQAMGPHTTGQQTTGQQTTGQRSAGQPTTGPQTTGPQTTGQRSAGQPTTGRQTAGQQSARAQRAGNDRTEMVSRRDLLDAAGIDDKQLAELEAHGLVRRVGRLYGQDALDVAATVAALASYGVQARHLRTVKTAADHQTSLIEQVVAPTLRQRSPHARDVAGRTAREIAALLLRLHRAMIESALAEAGLPGDELPEQETAPEPGTEPGAGRPESGLARRGLGGASA